MQHRGRKDFTVQKKKMPNEQHKYMKLIKILAIIFPAAGNAVEDQFSHFKSIILKQKHLINNNNKMYG